MKNFNAIRRHMPARAIAILGLSAMTAACSGGPGAEIRLIDCDNNPSDSNVLVVDRLEKEEEVIIRSAGTFHNYVDEFSAGTISLTSTGKGHFNVKLDDAVAVNNNNGNKNTSAYVLQPNIAPEQYTIAGEPGADGSTKLTIEAICLPAPTE